jgi:peptide/nickel transport system permease protein
MATESQKQSVTISESLFSRFKRTVRRLATTKKGAIGLALLVPVFVGTVFAPVIAPYDPTAQHVVDQFSGPSFEYLLGTDNFGRDLFSRVLYGGRASIAIGIGSTAVGLLLGVPIGITSGYLGGRVDEITMRAMDTLLSIPSLLFALLVVTGLGPGIVNTIFAIGLVFMPRLARLVRSSTLSVKNNEFITAAEARGESLGRVAFSEILPNVWPAIVVEGSIRIGFGILLGASLSFLGLGTQPPTPDWGRAVSTAQNNMYRSIWIVLVPSVALGITILGFNLLGDGLRDTLDPEAESEQL